MSRLAGWIMRWEPLILLALAPALVFATPERVLWLLALPLLWLVRYAAGRHFAPRTPLDWPILALLGALVVNLFASPSIVQSLPKISNLVFGICLYYGIVAWANSERRTGRLLLGLAGTACALVVVVLLVQWTAGLKIASLAPSREALQQIPRPLSLPGAEAGVNANEVGGTLVMFVPLCAMVALDAARKGRRSWLRVGLGLLAFAGTLAVTVLSQSRAAMGGMVVGLLALPAWRYRWGRVLLAATLVVVVLLALTGWLEPLLQGSGLFAAATEFDTLNGRVLVWRRGLYFLAQAPLTGIGLNQFRLAVPAFWPMSSPLAPGDLGHAHNQFLQAAVEMGLPGLAAYIGIWAASFGRVAGALRRWSRLGHGRAALGAASGLVAFGVYGMFDAVALGARAGFPFWMVLATVVALTEGKREQDEQDRQDGETGKRDGTRMAAEERGWGETDMDGRWRTGDERWTGTDQNRRTHGPGDRGRSNGCEVHLRGL